MPDRLAEINIPIGFPPLDPAIGIADTPLFVLIVVLRGGKVGMEKQREDEKA